MAVFRSFNGERDVSSVVPCLALMPEDIQQVELAALILIVAIAIGVGGVERRRSRSDN